MSETTSGLRRTSMETQFNQRYQANGRSAKNNDKSYSGTKKQNIYGKTRASEPNDFRAATY